MIAQQTMVHGPWVAHRHWWFGRHRCGRCWLFFARRDGVWLTVGRPYQMRFYCNQCQRMARAELAG
ncbi:MAG: hypothetical protein ACRDGS_14615 [Chloroflexota bacterium]